MRVLELTTPNRPGSFIRLTVVKRMKRNLNPKGIDSQRILCKKTIVEEVFEMKASVGQKWNVFKNA